MMLAQSSGHRFRRGGSRYLLAVLTLVVIANAMSYSTPVRADTGDRLAPLISIMLLLGRAPATTLDIGEHHGCARLEDGELACWGYNLFGQLGSGNDDNSFSPVTVNSMSTASSVGSGVRHSCAVLDDGTARCWGGNGYGQLGNNTHGNGTGSFYPVSVSGATTAASISAGDDFSCMVLTSGVVQCWGKGTDGQLGIGLSGFSVERDEPVSVNLVNYTAESVSAGAYHACMLDNHALLVLPVARCWGRNTSGQIGQGNNSLISTPTIVRNSANSGSLLGIGSVSAGDDHSCATLITGLVFCWGWNGGGQLGLTANSPSSSNLPVKVSSFGTLLPKAVSVSAGGDHSCALTEGGKVWCWGFDAYGQLGRGTSAVADHVPVAVTGINTAIAVGTGEFHSCALLADRSVWCWGRNHLQQLGVSTLTSSGVPVKVAGLTTISPP